MVSDWSLICLCFSSRRHGDSWWRHNGNKVDNEPYLLIHDYRLDVNHFTLKCMREMMNQHWKYYFSSYFIDAKTFKNQIWNINNKNCIAYRQVITFNVNPGKLRVEGLAEKP